MAEKMATSLDSIMSLLENGIITMETLGTSLDSIMSPLKNGLITIETLVREMEMYLTTTDNVIRARGILLLAEVLKGLALEPLDNDTIHNLIGFFASRLADWRALRGALVGCLVLVKRKKAGVVSSNDAKEVAESFLKNMQVQSLGQHDRKLCFELLDCLLERYPHEVASLGEELMYGVCESFDGERDHHCLMLVFNIVPVLVRILPPEALQSFSGELFEILSHYFPIHFTHQKLEDGVTRDDLSRALMIAFSSSPLFEPSVIPLLLEKLSSSLQSAKVDSLKYLSYCSVKYGADRMAKHAKAIWRLLKEELSTSLKEASESFPAESVDDLGFQENEIGVEALVLLETIVTQNNDLLLSLIVDDEDISSMYNSISSYGTYKDIPLQGKERLHVVGRILYITAKTSLASCNRILETFFPSLVLILQNSMRNSSMDLNFGALYLCTELLAACQDLIQCSRKLSSNTISAHEAFCHTLQSSCVSLISILCSTLATTTNEVHDVDYHFRVKSLQMLATFPQDILPLSADLFKNILTTLMSIILVGFNRKLFWKVALKALVQIGSFVSRCNEFEKALSYISIAVEKITSLISIDSIALPFQLKLEAICEIGASGRNHMLRIVQGMEGAISGKFYDIYVHGNTRSVDTAIQLLQCFSNKVIPWIRETGGLEEVLLSFAISIWDHVESWISHDVEVEEKELLDAAMMVMKLTVASCPEETQNVILQKAYTVLSSSTSLPLKRSTLISIPVQLEGSSVSQHINNISQRDEFILSLFASVIIAVHPRTEIPYVSEIAHLFLSMLLKEHVPSAQALGSMVNKFDSESKGTEISSGSILQEAIDIIFTTKFWSSHGNCVLESNGNEIGFIDLCRGCLNSTQLQIHAMIGLAWIGKGLLLRGHERVKDVIKILLDSLLPDGNIHASMLKHDLLHHSVMKTAADAFHILMSDTEYCLNKKFNAIARPLYKQRLFSMMMPIVESSLKKSESSFSRSMLYRASAHIISDAPLVVVLNEAKKVMSLILEGLSIFSVDVQDKENLYHLLLVFSGILTDEKGHETVIENAHSVIIHVTGLVTYPHMMLVRETAIQCLAAMSELPHAVIYPMKAKVLRALSKALGDSKRAVRQEAVRCRQAWVST